MYGFCGCGAAVTANPVQITATRRECLFLQEGLDSGEDILNLAIQGLQVMKDAGSLASFELQSVKCSMVLLKSKINWGTRRVTNMLDRLSHLTWLSDSLRTKPAGPENVLPMEKRTSMFSSTLAPSLDSQKVSGKPRFCKRILPAFVRKALCLHGREPAEVHEEKEDSASDDSGSSYTCKYPSYIRERP